MSRNYEYVNESSIDINLKCCICHDPYETPYVTSCDHTFCYKCIEQHIKINKSCPICRYQILTIENFVSVKTRLILNMLDHLLIKCKICNKEMEHGHFEVHFKKCEKRKKCFCSAADIRCPWIGLTDQLSSHLKKCPYEQIRPLLMEILTENRELKQKNDQYENELKKGSTTNNLEKEQINQLYQKCQQLENEIYHLKLKSISNQNNSVEPLINRPITFESLLIQNKLGPVPDGYAGLNWFNVRYTNEENARAIRPLHHHDRLSVFSRGYSCIIYNDWKYPMIISSMKQFFTLHACEIMSVNCLEDICKLNITGLQNKKSIYSKTILLKYNISKVIEFQSWINLDQIEFSIPNNYFILTWIQLGK